MLAILFPHMFEDLEYLLPTAAMEIDVDYDVVSNMQYRDRGRIECMQPAAGPSGLQ